MSEEFKRYRRMGVSEMRPYIPGEDLEGVSISKADYETDFTGNKEPDGYVSRNPDNHADRWYVAKAWFEKQQFQEVD